MPCQDYGSVILDTITARDLSKKLYFSIPEQTNGNWVLSSGGFGHAGYSVVKSALFLDPIMLKMLSHAKS